MCARTAENVYECSNTLVRVVPHGPGVFVIKSSRSRLLCSTFFGDS